MVDEIPAVQLPGVPVVQDVPAPEAAAQTRDNTTPVWANPGYHDDDIFKMSQPELDQLKTRVAWALGIRHRNQNRTAPFALDVSGIAAFDIDKVKAAIQSYVRLRSTRPVPTENEGEAAYSARLVEWESSMSTKSSMSTVINGLQLLWTNPGGPFNIGNIEDFWRKFASGEKTWDRNIERRVGGIPLGSDPDSLEYTALSFAVAGTTATMALIRAVAGHIMRTGTCPPSLAADFKSIRAIERANSTICIELVCRTLAQGLSKTLSKTSAI